MLMAEHYMFPTQLDEVDAISSRTSSISGARTDLPQLPKGIYRASRLAISFNQLKQHVLSTNNDSAIMA